MQRSVTIGGLILIVLLVGGAHGQSADIAVYTSNPHYFTVGGEPVFLIGATRQFGWMAVSKPDHDFMKDLDRLAASIAQVNSPHVRGLVRLIPYFPQMAGIQPWKLLPNNKYDLEVFNPAWERRLRRYLEAARQRGLVVSLEIWDDWSITRGQGGHYDPGPDQGWFVWNHPWHAWNDHPFNGANNVNYSTDVMPAVTSLKSAPFYQTIPSRQDNRKVLQYQIAYVNHLLSIAQDYPNIIYNLSNESRAPLAWSRYWANHLRDRLGQEAIIGDMPSTNRDNDRGQVDPNLNPLTLIGDELYDYVDISQAVSAHSFGGKPQNQAFLAGQRIAGYYRVMGENDTVKPLVVSKDYTNTAPGGVPVVWAKFFGGAASARFHRPMIHNQKMGPVEQIVDFQFEAITHLGQFVKRIPFWNYRPDTTTVLHTPEGVKALALTDEGRGYVVQVIGTGTGEMALRLDPGTYEVRWFDPYSGRYLESADAEVSLPSDHRREVLLVSLPEFEEGIIARITREE